MALDKMGTPMYLRKPVSCYFTDRVLHHDTEDGLNAYKVTGGVPQGLVLVPLLWNIMYDGLLKLEILSVVTPLAFAGLKILKRAAEKPGNLGQFHTRNIFLFPI